MKRNKGFIETTLVLMVLAFASLVAYDLQRGEKAPETPAVHNYNK